MGLFRTNADREQEEALTIRAANNAITEANHRNHIKKREALERNRTAYTGAAGKVVGNTMWNVFTKSNQLEIDRMIEESRRTLNVFRIINIILVCILLILLY